MDEKEWRNAAERIIGELDSIAREYDHHAYGLPIRSLEYEKLVAAVVAELQLLVRLIEARP